VAVSREESKPYQYLRQRKKFPNMWCPGCGIGIVMGAVIRAVDRLKIPKDEIAMISGIGCSGRMPVYLDFDTMHTTHGRALAFATGLKMVRPHMHVIAVMGDGDALAIGGNHFIHAARRNIGITAIVINNSIYGMTGGQVSPTTPTGMLAATAPYGTLDQPFETVELAKGARATFVARGTVYHAIELDRLIEKALAHKGFSVVEAVSYCHTTYGRVNCLGGAVEMLRAQKENSVSAQEAEGMTAEQLRGKIVRGVLHDVEWPEYTDAYRDIIERAARGDGGERHDKG
jgi:2-oxoglutarate/2-oxoacid ferredoxin oxidoreductase subunit beta